MKSSEAILAYQRRYRAAHRDEKRAYNASYYAAHRDDECAYSRAYRASHHDGRRAYNGAYYRDHREEILAQKATYNAAHREERALYYRARTADRLAFLDKAKSGVGCMDCGATDMLQFHHRDKTTKRYKVSNMLWMPWCEIMDEIWKCDVLCCSCHSKRHRAEDKLLVV